MPQIRITTAEIKVYLVVKDCCHNLHYKDFFKFPHKT